MHAAHGSEGKPWCSRARPRVLSDPCQSGPQGVEQQLRPRQQRRRIKRIGARPRRCDVPDPRTRVLRAEPATPAPKTTWLLRPRSRGKSTRRGSDWRSCGARRAQKRLRAIDTCSRCGVVQACGSSERAAETPSSPTLDIGLGSAGKRPLRNGRSTVRAQTARAGSSRNIWRDCAASAADSAVLCSDSALLCSDLSCPCSCTPVMESRPQHSTSMFGI